ncbi:MAG: hypothetical protein OXG37_01055 [Actinomycetia bacterium]|nr:hypothetical protein [Actinomycetes bacterium]
MSELQGRIEGRLSERLYGQPIINNVARGLYVECMVELALQERDPAWRLTDAWGGWDLEHCETLARLEVKQSAALQIWKETVKRSPTFGIPPRKWWWDNASSVSVETRPQRLADVYVFAWHPESGRSRADHREPDQWEFYVVAERDLSQQPLTASISLGPLRRLAPPCGYNELACKVTDTVSGLPSLKAQTSSEED